MERRSAGKGKHNNKKEIVRYIFKHKNASKAELAKELELSMPTVLQNTKELLEQGILLEGGEYESTGGRRAKSLMLNRDAAYAVGLDITRSRVSFVLINLKGEILKQVDKQKEFSGSIEYYSEVFCELEDFIQKQKPDESKILGVGIALPGVIDKDGKTLIMSYALKQEGVGLHMFNRLSSRELHFENDANAAFAAESNYSDKDAMYLFLGDTVGGAIRKDGKLFSGNNRKAGEFGHVILVPGGKECQCGKKGCVDSYCSVHALEEATGFSLEETMERVAAKDPKVLDVWNEYLYYLATTVSNLRRIYDTDIILGGDVGAYLESYMLELGKCIMELDSFESDISYLKNSVYKKGGAAAGAALHFIYRFIDELT